MDFIELLRVVFLSIIQGITEWLPVSSTGHMVLVDEFLNFTYSEEFRSVFFVVIQLASVMAVVTTFFRELMPFTFKDGFKTDMDKMQLWVKIVVASIPAGIVGIFFDDMIEDLFFNPLTIAVMLIGYGIVFIIVESMNRHHSAKIKSLSQITYGLAFMIGIFQMLAIIPGTSRSGATIIGGLIFGMSRKSAAEFTFFLAIPAMAGASLLRIVNIGLNFTMMEWVTMVVGCLVAFLVSIITIKFLLNFIKRNNFKPFAYYRIMLGFVVLAYFYWL